MNQNELMKLTKQLLNEVECAEREMISNDFEQILLFLRDNHAATPLA
jgi:hypothetical protein